jgi:hypothetical protein
MGWKSELQHLSVERNGFIKIFLLIAFLKSGRQSHGKIVNRFGSIRMGWRPELKSLPIERNAFIEVLFLTSFLKLSRQSQGKIVE